MQLTVCADSWESLLLDGGRAEFDALQDAGVENVDTSVDAVTHELDGLLNEAVYPRWVVGLVDNNTILGGLLHLGHHNCALIAMLFVELGKLLEGVVAGDIGVEDEEGSVALAEDALGELQGAGGAKRLGLYGELNVDLVEVLILDGF